MRGHGPCTICDIITFYEKDVFDNQVMQEQEIFHSVPTLDELNQDREMCKKKTTEENLTGKVKGKFALPLPLFVKHFTVFIIYVETFLQK